MTPAALKLMGCDEPAPAKQADAMLLALETNLVLNEQRRGTETYNQACRHFSHLSEQQRECAREWMNGIQAAHEAVMARYHAHMSALIQDAANWRQQQEGK